MTNILLFQRELRISDNALIEKAVALNSNFIPVFIFDEKYLSGIKNKESKQVNFLVSAVVELKNELNAEGSELFVFYGDKNNILKNLIKVLNCETIICGKTYEKDVNELYDGLSKLCKIDEVSDSFFSDFDIVKGNGEAFKVFTPYKNEFLKNIKKFSKSFPHGKVKFPKINYKEFNNLLQKFGFIKDVSVENILKTIKFKKSDLGEFDVKSGQNKIDDFCKNRAKNYDVDRDFPSVDGTSKLSPYLRYGVVSPKRCFEECFKHSGIRGVNTWLWELIWREFYATTLFHFPEIQNHEFIKKYEKIKWKYDKDKLNAWKDGKTGYPIIDAGMRQLKETGWMHNRVRMVVASFLTKNLLIDWREGEKHFANYLIDYELASNVGGWQWSASVGIDPQPYFRIFNPYLQSKKFDKNGEYIKKYVPELASIDATTLHKDINIEGYVKQIVNYSKSRVYAIAEFKKIK
ncbi:MAG TPA: deoxyribodipyrimidine photo-lyase [Rickettsiales bacterium]|nr:deoxyribodipyrimidine photo-lyase [Rickettsiales bacterium]